MQEIPQQRRTPLQVCKRFFPFLLLSSVCLAGDYNEQVGPFGTLDNTHAAVTIPNNMSSDLLNVDITPQGKSVKKRKGYGTSFTLSNATSAVHGTYLFYDSNGSDVVLAFNDRNMNVSVSGGNPTVFFSTGSNGATYQCVDSAAFGYCANSARTSIVKVNSSTYTLITSVVSTGSIVAVTPERLVMSGFSEAPSRVDFSKANDFTTWTPGGNPTDPINFTIVSPGSRITHLTYAHGRIYWFKDTSFGYILPGASQGDWVVRTVNSFIGTNYNTSIFRDDVLYFQGNDGHFYAWDGSNLTKLSTNIQTTINQTQGRSLNSWTQDTQADWQAGTSTYTDISTTLIPGSVAAKTTSYFNNNFQYVTALTKDWTYVDTVTVPTSLRTLWPDPFDSWRYGPNYISAWSTFTINGTNSPTISASGGLLSIQDNSPVDIRSAGIASNYIMPGTLTFGTSFYVSLSSCPSSGSGWAFGISSPKFSQTDGWQNGIDAELVVTKNTIWYSAPNQGFLTRINTLSTPISCPGDVTLFVATSNYYAVTSSGTLSSSGTINSNFPMVSSNSWSAFIQQTKSSPPATDTALKIDQFSIAPETFTVTASTMNTGILYPVWGTLTSTEPISVDPSSFTATSQSSLDGITFDSGVNITTGAPITSNPKQYVKLNMNVFQATCTGSAASYSNQFTAGSSGTFISQTKNAPNLTSWDSFTANTQATGGTHTFYIRSDTWSITAISTFPVWTALTNGGTPSVTPKVYFQIRDDLRTTGGGQFSLDSFTQSWFEGAASDKAYGIYHDNGLWWAVASGTGATANNKILKYDLLNQGWLIYDLPMNGMYVKSQSLYFGSASAGKIHKFGDVDNDNGSAINAYWKSKDFFGTNPFLDKDYKSLSVFAGSVANSSMTVTYTVSGTSSTVITIPLYDANHSFIRYNKNLPLRVGNTFNVKFGNNAADQTFEVYGIQIGTNEKPWNAQ